MRAHALVLALLLAGCSGSTPTPPNPAPGMITMGGNGWSFAFPTAPPGIHSATKAPTEGGRSNIVYAYTVSGDGASFVSVQDGGAASVTLFIQRCGDNWSAQGAYASYRFYSTSTQLAVGQFGGTTPLTQDRWTNVWGQQDAVGLQATLAALCSVGFVYGNPSAGATAHGAYATGAATFTVDKFALE